MTQEGASQWAARANSARASTEEGGFLEEGNFDKYPFARLRDFSVQLLIDQADDGGFQSAEA
jgi:hypothetical protein